MSLLSFISKQRRQYSIDLANDARYWSLSAITLTYFRHISCVMDKYAKGKVLDAGAGALNAKSLILKRGAEYVSLDIEKRNRDIDLIGDIQSMVDVPSKSFDTVYSSQVLEHVPLPINALSEIYRVLKPGGYAIISVPHLSSLHEEPLDFYRYTPYGLRFLMEKAQFVIEAEYCAGGLFCFLSHSFSLISVSLFWSIPGIRWLVLWINKILLAHPAMFIDKILKLELKFPANIIMVGKKRMSSNEKN